MIENPSNLTQQLLNLVERVAVEIRAIYNKLKTAVFKVNGQLIVIVDGNFFFIELGFYRFIYGFIFKASDNRFGS